MDNTATPTTFSQNCTPFMTHCTTTHEYEPLLFGISDLDSPAGAYSLFSIALVQCHDLTGPRARGIKIQVRFISEGATRYPDVFAINEMTALWALRLVKMRGGKDVIEVSFQRDEDEHESSATQGPDEDKKDEKDDESPPQKDITGKKKDAEKKEVTDKKQVLSKKEVVSKSGGTSKKDNTNKNDNTGKNGTTRNNMTTKGDITLKTHNTCKPDNVWFKNHTITKLDNTTKKEDNSDEVIPRHRDGGFQWNQWETRGARKEAKGWQSLDWRGTMKR